MKKTLLTLAFALAALVGNAQETTTETILPLGGQSSGDEAWSWGTTQTVGAEVTLAFSSAYGEYVLASSLNGYTKYKLVVKEANPLINLRINGDNTNYIAVSSTELSGDIPEGATKFELQATKANQNIEVQSFVLIDADGNETQSTEYSINWGVKTCSGVYTSTDSWAQIQISNYENIKHQIIKVYTNEPIPENVQFKVIYADETEGYPAFTVGATEFEYEFTQELKEISIQFKASDVTLNLAKVTQTIINDEEPGTTEENGSTTEEKPTAVSTVTATDNNAIVAIYALDGTQLNSIQKGINIVKKADGSTIKVIK